MSRLRRRTLLLSFLLFFTFLVVSLFRAEKQELIASSDFTGAYLPYAQMVGKGGVTEYLSVVIPPGYPWYLYLVSKIAGWNSYRPFWIIPWLLMGLLPVALFVMFRRSVGLLCGALCGIGGYVLAEQTRAYEIHLATEALSNVIIALILISVFHATKMRQATLKCGIYSSSAAVLLAYLMFLRPQFQLLWVPVIGSVIISLLIAQARQRNVISWPSWQNAARFTMVISGVWLLAYGGWKFRNLDKHGDFSFMPNGPLNLLNHSVAYIHEAVPETDVQRKLLKEILKERQLRGNINTLAGGVDQEIMRKLDLTLIEYIRETKGLVNQVLKKRQGSYLVQGISNLNKFFRVQLDSYFGNFWLLERYPVTAGEVEGKTNLLPQRPWMIILVIPLLLGPAVMLFYGRRFDHILPHVILPAIIWYCAATAAFAQNTDYLRYCVTSQWLWIGYILFCASLLIKTVIRNYHSRGAIDKL